MATAIDSTALVASGAYLADGVVVGPFCVVQDDVHVGAGTVLRNSVTLLRGTRLGKRCDVWPGVVLGGEPQDHKYRGERSYLVVGDNNILREGVTLHRATGEGESTRLGNDNYVMTYVHVGHNCRIGDSNILSSYAGISGHAEIGDAVVLGGHCGVHQYARIGRLAMLGGGSMANQDIPPFMLAAGNRAEVVDLNTVGLRRAGVPPASRSALKLAYKLLYRSGLNVAQAIARIDDEVERTEEVAYLLEFLRVTRAGHAGRGAVSSSD